ncbi:MAG: hypothetical protein HYU67_12225 [Flavobacteriia bacterium]|nr:hypothetical protein [Flavobacteriia bacterium]
MEKVHLINRIKSIEFQSNKQNVWMFLERDSPRKNTLEFSLSHKELNQFLLSLTPYLVQEENNELLWSEQISEEEFLYGLHIDALKGNWIESLQGFIDNIQLSSENKEYRFIA